MSKTVFIKSRAQHVTDHFSFTSKKYSHSLKPGTETWRHVSLLPSVIVSLFIIEARHPGNAIFCWLCLVMCVRCSVPFFQAANRSDSMTLTPGQWLGLPAVTAVTLYRHEDPALVGFYWLNSDTCFWLSSWSPGVFWKNVIINFQSNSDWLKLSCS